MPDETGGLTEIWLREDPERSHFRTENGRFICPTCGYRHVAVPNRSQVITTGLVLPGQQVDVRRSYNGRNSAYVRRPPRTYSYKQMEENVRRVRKMMEGL